MPTLKTRLTERSSSYADLTQTIKKGINIKEFEAIRKDLKNAVFEEWYFRKFTEAKEARLKREKEEEERNLQEEEERKDIEERSKEEFDKWIERKKKEVNKKSAGHADKKDKNGRN